jgi:uncharacterized protein YbjT (DUF2867 family)
MRRITGRSNDPGEAASCVLEVDDLAEAEALARGFRDAVRSLLLNPREWG